MEATKNENNHDLSNTKWIKDLVKAEQQLEESGIIDVHFSQDQERTLSHSTIDCLNLMKTQIIEACTIFNEMKSSPIGRIKIYNVANTASDFMLFRNGYKMVFSAKQAGIISIRFNFISTSTGSSAIPSVTQTNIPQMIEENILEAKIGAFNEVQWTHQKQSIKLDTVVRFHFSMFARESTK